MKYYNHAYLFAFSCLSDLKEGALPCDIRQGIMEHLASIDDAELLENCGEPFDTFEEEV